jgi:hypothetical protein
MDPGGAQLYKRSLQAYDKAVTLLPKDALWHAGYAELLGYHAYFEGLSGTNTDDEVTHSLSEIEAARQLAPNDPQVLQISDEISSFFPGGQTPHEFHLGLTATAALDAPTQSATQLAQVILTATTLAQIPASTPGTQTTPESKPSSPFCGSAILLPILLVGLLYGKRRPGHTATEFEPNTEKNAGQ